MNTAAAFSSEILLNSLLRLPEPAHYWVGFSGGADSTALLHAMFECRERLSTPFGAVHFHHGLHEDASAWQAHCAAFCDERNIPYRAEKLDIVIGGRSSLEEEARNCRYRAVADLLGRSEMYLTAHHAEDQAETLFLNLMRGSGIEGLAGIPELRNLEQGWVARPLLDIHREQLIEYLESRGIAWLTDPSNADTSFDRNYLRCELFPVIEKRWPGVARRLARTARNARAMAGAMAMFIENQSGDLIRDPLRMPAHKLLELGPEMQALILRQWLRRNEVPMLPESRLQEFLTQLSDARQGSQAEVQWEDWMIKHYRHDLWLHRREPFIALSDRPWSSGMSLDLGPSSGTLELIGEPARIPPGWVVGPRRGGARIRTVEQGPSRKLKHFFQSATIPPWLRPGIPVIYWDDEPVALGDWVIGHRLNWWLMENGLDLAWRPADPVLERLHADCQTRTD
jgi:tRNA(Ile)-lysidine synthase